VYAPIETLPANPFVGAWRIGGVTFTATAATSFEQASASFAVGVCVEAKYMIDGSVNQLVAIESKPLARCQIGGVLALRAYGPISAFPVGLVGPWTVGGVSYQATASTSFEQRFGRFVVGAFVELIYRVENSNRIATRIETHVAPGEGRIHAVGAPGLPAHRAEVAAQRVRSILGAGLRKREFGGTPSGYPPQTPALGLQIR
jgi:hypothetical protein